MKVAEARETIAHARKLAVSATKRERQQVKAISLMIDGDINKAYRLIREHLDEFPRDMLMVRLCQPPAHPRLQRRGQSPTSQRS